jgi:hypothetical protein
MSTDPFRAWCRGPGCACEDHGPAAHQQRYEREVKGGAAWWAVTLPEEALRRALEPHP